MVGESMINWDSGKNLLLNVLDYARAGIFNLSTLISKYIPFEPSHISLVIFGVLSLYIAGRITDPRQNGNVWLLISGILFYALYFWGAA